MTIILFFDDLIISHQKFNRMRIKNIENILGAWVTWASCVLIYLHNINFATANDCLFFEYYTSYTWSYLWRPCKEGVSNIPI